MKNASVRIVMKENIAESNNRNNMVDVVGMYKSLLNSLIIIKGPVVDCRFRKYPVRATKILFLSSLCSSSLYSVFELKYYNSN
jgi:hypothetical protein